LEQTSTASVATVDRVIHELPQPQMTLQSTYFG
jgi:hypothetical protein